MQTHIIAILTLSITACYGGSIAELSNDDLFEAFNGRQVKGYSAAALHTELGGPEAVPLVEKCMKDERLRKTLIVFPEHITDPALKEKVMEFILEEPGVWLADEEHNPASKAPWMQASYFAGHGLREAFHIEETSPELDELSKALLKKSTRLLIANLYHDLTSLDADQRKPDAPEMKAAVEDLRQILAGAKPSNLAAAQRSLKDPSFTAPASAGTKAAGEETKDASRWIAVVSVVLLAVAGFFAFRRKGAKA